MVRIFPPMLTVFVATFISASLANTLLGQEHSTASFSRQFDEDDALPPSAAPVASIVPAVQQQRIAARPAPFQVAVAAPAQVRLSNEQDTVSSTLKPLSQFQFRAECEDCRSKDFFADLKVNSEMPAVSLHEKGWVPAGMVHRPLYFEEHCLEQCGQTAPGIRQPFVSGTRFFVRGIFFPIQTIWNRPRTLQATDSNECNFFDE